MSQKLATIKSMLDEGWVRTTINGVKCIKMVDTDYTFIAQANRAGYMYPEDMLNITEKLGKPHKIHTHNGQVLTLEY